MVHVCDSFSHHISWHTGCCALPILGNTFERPDTALPGQSEGYAFLCEFLGVFAHHYFLGCDSDFFLVDFQKANCKKSEKYGKTDVACFPGSSDIVCSPYVAHTRKLENFTSEFQQRIFQPELVCQPKCIQFFWSFNYGWMHNKMAKNPLPYFDDNTCLTNMQGIDQLNQEELPVYIKSPNGKPVNVVMIILESFSNNVIGKLGGTPGVTPCFDEFCDDGILFSSFYATGSRSDKGLSSLLGSYPALMKTTNLLQEPEKMKKIVFLPEYFGNWGYDLSFYYGGDIDFFNTSLMLIQSGVQKIISDKDFSKTISSLQRWGVPDEYLFQRMESDLRQMKKPFFSIAYTLSSHEPFDVPKFKRITESTVAGQYKNAIAYSDSCLGQFINDLKKTPLWKNTIVIITADHASLYAGNFTFEEPISYRIPMLWIGGAVDTSFICNNICMQTDLTSTLLQQLGEKQKPSWFSKNIFGSRQYAFFIGNEGWGFISPETAFYRNLESGKQRFFYGEKCSAADSLDTFSKSFMQFLHKDFIEK